MKRTPLSFTLQCLKFLRSCKKIAKALSLLRSHVFKGTRGNKGRYNWLDSWTQNIILGALLLSEFSEAFQMTDGFQHQATESSCSSLPNLCTGIYIYQPTGMKDFCLGY